jgi:hypothetical protein
MYMRSCIADSRNTIVLALATCGGFITDKGSMRLVNISIQRKNKDGLDEHEFVQFEVTNSELQELYEESNLLRSEINVLLENEAETKKKHEDEKAQYAAKKIIKKPELKKKKDSTPESLFRFGDEDPDDGES